MCPMLIIALLTTAELWKPPQCTLIDEWIKKKKKAVVKILKWNITHP